MTYGLTLAELCDLTYLLQVEAIERRALAEITLAPHLGRDSTLPSPEDAREAFDTWLNTPPVPAAGQTGDTELFDLLGLRGGKP